MTEIGLDETDRRLIQLLRSDARLPAATLAKHLGVSRGTVQNRIERLRSAGILLGFTVRLRGDVGSAAVRAITTVEVRSADTKSVLAALKRMPDVGEIHSTNGRWDLVIEINAASLEGLDKVLAEIRGQRAITHSETSILLSALK